MILLISILNKELKSFGYHVGGNFGEMKFSQKQVFCVDLFAMSKSPRPIVHNL